MSLITNEFLEKQARLKKYPLKRFIPDEFFLFTTAFLDRGSLICENCMYFLIRGGKNISVSRRGKKSVKNHTFYWFLARDLYLVLEFLSFLQVPLQNPPSRKEQGSLVP
jgi:hypothetical protein